MQYTLFYMALSFFVKLCFTGLFPSALHHKSNAVPGELQSKFTTSEKSCTVSHRSEYTHHIFVNLLVYHVTTLKKLHFATM